MPNLKISALTDGAPAVGSDQLPVARAGTNRRITVANLLAAGDSVIVPSQTLGITGTTTNNSVNAGGVGEYIESVNTNGTINTASISDITSISLTAGDWDVTAFINSAGTSTNNNIRLGISAVSATFPGHPGEAQVACNTTGQAASGGIPNLRVSLAATTTYYFVGQAGAAIVNNVNFRLSARRVR